MESEKIKVIEYSADYRDSQKKSTNSVECAANSYRKEFNSTKSSNLISKKEKNNSDAGAIKITRTNRKQIGIYRIFLAGITMIFAVVGVIILLSTINRTNSVISLSPTYAKYNNFIAPVVMHDPEPFPTPSEANLDMIISSSIWRNILQKGLENYVEFDDQGLTLMPLADVQNAAVALFGSDILLDTSENIFGPFYSYTVGESNFHIGAISNSGTFVPLVEEIAEKDGELLLTVSYIAREDKFLSDGNDKADFPTPVKQMIYKLALNSTSNKFFISAIEKISKT